MEELCLKSINASRKKIQHIISYDDNADHVAACLLLIWKDKSDGTEEVNIEAEEASNVKCGETRIVIWRQTQYKKVEHSGPLTKLNLNSQSRAVETTNDEEMIEYYKLEWMQKRKKRNYMTSSASIKDSFKDFVPMDSEKETGDVIGKRCSKFLKEEESYNYCKNSIKKPKLRTPSNPFIVAEKNMLTEKNNLLRQKTKILKKMCMFKDKWSSFQDAQQIVYKILAQRMKLKRLKASTAYMTEQTYA
ncbi:hypothetical protein Tco_0557013 [Tanacetum coccineum]